MWITCYIRLLQRESWHYSLWLSLISFCIGDDETIVFRSKQRSLFHQSIGMLLAVVDLIWQTKPMTEESIQHLEHAIITWRNHQTLNFARFSPSKDQHENFHKLCHAPAHVRRNGGLSTTCTSSYEKSHGIMAKKPAKQHNHRNQEKRMLYVVRRAQLLSQRKLGSGKAYTKAMYRSMRGDDPGFENSSIHTSKNQVCVSLALFQYKHEFSSSQSGSVNVIENGIMQYYYGRPKTVFLPQCALNVLLQQCWKAVKDGTDNQHAARVSEDEISYHR